MNRINACFEKLNSDRMKGLIAFVTAGDPTLEATPDIMHALVAGGLILLSLECHSLILWLMGKLSKERAKER